MPIYEYECDQCHNRFETIQYFSDKPLNKCKKCGGRLHKLVSECSFHLKGTGWYVSDYRKTGSSTETSSKSKKPSDESKSKPDSSSASAKKKSED